MATPKKRLSNVCELQWELDAWLQHYISWAVREPMVQAECERKADALDKASQILFKAFGQPDPDAKLK